jgi:hypothetical protein
VDGACGGEARIREETVRVRRCPIPPGHTLAETIDHMQLVMGGGQSDRANPSWAIPPSPFGSRGHRLTAVVLRTNAGYRSVWCKGSDAEMLR